MTASAVKPRIAPAIPTTRPADNNPCSNGRSVCVREICESQPSTPECPAAVKSSTHDPMVTAKTMMAAVALLSEMAAANSAIAPISIP